MLLLVVVFGIRTVSAALAAGVLFAFGPTFQSAGWLPGWLRAVMLLLTGLAAIGISRNPAGLFGLSSPAELLSHLRRAPLAAAPATESSITLPDATAEEVASAPR
jgi:hypothetical protein